MKKILIPAWIFAAIFLFLYSFTQVDLGLTLTRASFIQVTQTSFQHIGYFNRPLSTYLYVAILLLFFGLYITTLKQIIEKKLSMKDVWRIIIPVSVILLFSYNAFSYDMFNYIFDARIITEYQENPYVKKALDFPDDPMLSFMHWTHRTYPYGPVWLLLTVPLVFLSFGKFLLAFYLLKVLMVLSYLGTVFFLQKLMELVKHDKKDFVVAFFALNPLVLIESLVSAHNDIVMMFFAILSLYLLERKRLILSYLMLIVSVAVKFATVFIAPFYVLSYFLPIVKKYFYELLTGVMTVAVVLATNREEFQPWYLLFLLPFAAVISYKKFILIPGVILTFGALLKYVPYLYTGSWNDPIPSILNYMYLGSIMLSISSVAIYYIFLKRK